MLAPTWIALAVVAAVAKPDAAAMVRAYENGNISFAYKVANELVADETSPAAAKRDAALVLTFTAVRRGRHADVLESLAAAEAAGADLGDYGLYLAVNAHVGSRDCETAETRAGELNELSPFASAAWSRVGACWLREKDLARADLAVVKSSQLARNDGQTAETMLARAHLAAATKDLSGAVAILKSVSADYPETAAGRQARSELTRYGAHIPELTADDLLERAARERVLYRWVARRTYRSILARPKAGHEARGKARLGLIQIEVVDKRYPLALIDLEKLINDAIDASVLAQAHFLRGDVLARRGKVAEALDELSAACIGQPEEPYARESALMGARLAYASRDLAKAKWFAHWLIAAKPVDRADALITEDGAIGPGHLAPELVDGANWYAAWTERRSGAPRELVDALLAGIDVHGSMGPAALYWRLRYALEAKDAERAHVLAGQLLEVAPTSYYALAAADLICGTDPACPLRVNIGEAAKISGAEAPPPVARSAAMIGVVTLYRAGLASEAERLTRIVPQAALADPDKLVVAWLDAREDDVRVSAMIMRRLITASLAQLRDPLMFALAYPRPYRDIVDRTGASYDLPPELIYAIIREESSFDARALSPRAARGLMQMMRPTAQGIARELGVKGFAARKLFDPPVSIRFGTHYLANLLDMFDGDVSAVAASYHAGENAVSRWRSRLGKIPIDEFIEEIPYASTRKYVQKVIASFGMYRLLYGHAGGTLLEVAHEHGTDTAATDVAPSTKP